MASVMPLSSRFSPRVFAHVWLQAKFQASGRGLSEAALGNIKSYKLSKSAYANNLKSMRGWIAGLRPKKANPTTWQNYESERNYSDTEVARKREIVRSFFESAKPSMAMDIGCNTGEFAKIALDAGARAIIGLDIDTEALNKACTRAAEKNLNFLPLYHNLANPSPAQGWRCSERPSLLERAKVDAVVALALVHHLAITHNIPLDEIIEMIIGIAPEGLIEFVPKTDPMVKRLLSLRDDVFYSYSEDVFAASIAHHAQIIRKDVISESGRVIYQYRKTT